MAAEKAKVDKLILDNNLAKDEEVKAMKEEKDKYKAELEQFKSEFQMKMTQIKLMEMELEEKLAQAQDGTVDD